MIARSVGKRIRQLRKQEGLTQKALAQKASVSTVYVQKVELGERTPSGDVLERIARALKVDVLLDREAVFFRRPVRVSSSKRVPREGRVMSGRTKGTCAICTWADEMLAQRAADPAIAESNLARVGMALQGHRAQIQERLREVEQRYLAPHRAK